MNWQKLWAWIEHRQWHFPNIFLHNICQIWWVYTLHISAKVFPEQNSFIYLYHFILFVTKLIENAWYNFKTPISKWIWNHRVLACMLSMCRHLRVLKLQKKTRPYSFTVLNYNLIKITLNKVFVKREVFRLIFSPYELREFERSNIPTYATIYLLLKFRVTLCSQSSS